MGKPAAAEGDLIISKKDVPLENAPATNSHEENLPSLEVLGKLNAKLSLNVRVNGKRAATQGSMAITQGPEAGSTAPNSATVLMGSKTVRINGKPAARNGDPAITGDDVEGKAVGTVIATGTVRMG